MFDWNRYKPEQRRCTKCGLVRNAATEFCPSCHTKRSRKFKIKAGSFWKLPLETRRQIAQVMYKAISQDQPDVDAAEQLFSALHLPYFKEYRRYYRMFRWSYICDGEEQLDFEWYKNKPDKKHNPFTGLLWPPRDL